MRPITRDRFSCSNGSPTRLLRPSRTLRHIRARLESPVALRGLLVHVIVVTTVFKINAPGYRAIRNTDDYACGSKPLHTILSSRPEVLGILWTGGEAADREHLSRIKARG